MRQRTYSAQRGCGAAPLWSAALQRRFADRGVVLHRRAAARVAARRSAPTLRRGWWAAVWCWLVLGSFALAQAPEGEDMFGDEGVADVKFRFRTRWVREVTPERPRVLVSHRLPEGMPPPVIDGAISDGEVWTLNRLDRPQLTPEEVRCERTADAFSQVISNVAPAKQTVGYICHDAEKIYLCYVNEEPEKRRTRMEKREDIWNDDVDEVFFEIGDVNGAGTRFQLLFHLKHGSQYTNGHYWKEGDGQWERAGAWGANRWICEVALPYRSLKSGEFTYRGPPKRGELWGLKMCREGNPVASGTEERMLASWSLLPVASFELAEYSGMLVFEDRNALRNGDLRAVGPDGVPQHWRVVRARLESTASLARKQAADGTGWGEFSFDLRESTDAAALRQEFGVRPDAFYRVSADLDLATWENAELKLEVYRPGEAEPFQTCTITKGAAGYTQSTFEFHSPTDTDLTFSLTATRGRGTIRIRELRVEQQVFAAPPGTYCLTNNTTRTDLRFNARLAALNTERAKQQQPLLPTTEGCYTYRLGGSNTELFPYEWPYRRFGARDAQAKGSPEKEVKTGWVPFSKGSLTEGQGPADQSWINYPAAGLWGLDVPEPIDLLFDLQQNCFVTQLEVTPRVGELSQVEVYLRAANNDREYLVYRMNGPGVLNPIPRTYMAKVRGLDSVARYVRIVYGPSSTNLNEVRIWGQEQGRHAADEMKPFRWKSGLVLPPREYEQFRLLSEPFIFPIPREFAAGTGAFTLRPETLVIHADNERDRRSAALLVEWYRDQYGLAGRLTPETPNLVAPPGSIVLGTAGASPLVQARLAALGQGQALAGLSADGYLLSVTADGVVIAGAGPGGVCYGQDSLRQLTRGAFGGPVTARSVTVRDWPNVELRSKMPNANYPRLDPATLTAIARVYCRLRYNAWYLSSPGAWTPSVARVFTDHNLGAVLGAGFSGSGRSIEVAPDEAGGDLASERFRGGSRRNPSPAHPQVFYNLEASVAAATSQPLVHRVHLGHDEMYMVDAGSRWNESRLSLLRGLSGGDLFAEVVMREHDLTRQARVDAISLNTTLTTHGPDDAPRFKGISLAYPLLPRDLGIDIYHNGTGSFGDPYYANTAGFEDIVYIWGRPVPGQYWGHGVLGYWLANWAYTTDPLIDLRVVFDDGPSYSGTPCWAMREGQYAWFPEGAKASLWGPATGQPVARVDTQGASYPLLLANVGARCNELISAYPSPVLRQGQAKTCRVLDLQPFLNWTHVDVAPNDGRGWVDRGPNADLRRLPSGPQRFLDVPYFIHDPRDGQAASVAMLQNEATTGALAGAHRQLVVPVGQDLASLLVLATTMLPGGPAPRYVVEYAAGGYLDLELVPTSWEGGGGLEQTVWLGQRWPAWLGDVPCGDPAVLYAQEWVNPYPEKSVKQFRIAYSRPEDSRQAEALFALTTLAPQPCDVAFWQAPGRRRPLVATAPRLALGELGDPRNPVLAATLRLDQMGHPLSTELTGREAAAGVVGYRTFDVLDGQRRVTPLQPAPAPEKAAVYEGRVGAWGQGAERGLEVHFGKPLLAAALGLQPTGGRNLVVRAELSADGTTFTALPPQVLAPGVGISGFRFAEQPVKAVRLSVTGTDDFWLGHLLFIHLGLYR